VNGSNQKDVKLTNRHLLYECIRKNGPLTLTVLERTTNLSRPTVAGLVREMEKDNLIKKMGLESSSGGRAPMLYGINPDAFYALGIDFDFPTSRMAISNLNGHIVFASKKGISRRMNTRQVLDALIEQIDSLIIESGLNRSQLLGIGFGMPGTIDYKNGRSIVFERIADWQNVSLSEVLTDRFRIPVVMENDVHMLTWAERRLWTRADFSNMLFISIRSGIGMSVMMNGSVLEGQFGNAGFIGHTVVDVNGPECSCGKRGCLEVFASELHMMNMYAEKTGRALSNIRELFDIAHKEDPVAREIIASAGYYLGIGIGNAALTFDIPTVVVSAWFDHSSLLERAQETVDRTINQFRREGKIQIFPGRLCEEEYALGGCLRMIEVAQMSSASRVIANAQ